MLMTTGLSLRHPQHSRVITRTTANDLCFRANDLGVPMAQSTTFAAALRVARRNSADPARGGHLTLERLAELISQRLATDNQPTPQTVGNWERGFSRPSQKDRDMLMALVAVLAACRGLSRPTEADQLLSLGGYAALSEAERVACFGESPDAALSLAPATPAPPFTVPYPPNPLFVGRDADLEHLYDLLRPDASVALVPAVAGTGGIGKTQLAIEFAHHYCNQFPGGVFWLTMTDDASVRTQLVDYAGPRGLNLSGWPAMGYDDRIAAVRAAWQQPHIRLLIFDNLEDPALLAWRPTSGGCRVLITSRRLTWHRHSGVEALPLDVLARPDSRRLLLTPRYGDRSVLPGDAATADAICEELGDLPLALVLAGIYLEATPSMALDAYLVRLRAASVNHPSLNALLEEGLPTGHAPSILATFGLSYQRLDTANPTDALALRLLHRAAWCAPVAIPRRLLLRAADLDPDDVDAQAEADAALRRLAAVGLIEPLSDGALRLHHLLAAYARARAADSTGDCAFVEQALVAESADLHAGGSPQVWQPYLDHLRFAVTRAEPRDDTTATLLTGLAVLLKTQGAYAEARSLLERALAIRERVLGPEHSDTATGLTI